MVILKHFFPIAENNIEENEQSDFYMPISVWTMWMVR